MSAFQSAKVWTIDTGTKLRPRRPRPEVSERVERPARRPADERKRAVRNAKIAVWARLIVVGALATAMLLWPYSRTCGVGLATYLAATTMIIVGGLWVVACTWIVRMPRTHGVAMLLTLWGVGLVCAEVLPRVGYAMPDAAHPPIWSCDASSVFSSR